MIEGGPDLHNAHRRLGDESTLKPLITTEDADEVSGLFDKSVIQKIKSTPLGQMSLSNRLNNDFETAATALSKRATSEAIFGRTTPRPDRQARPPIEFASGCGCKPLKNKMTPKKIFHSTNLSPSNASMEQITALANL